MIGRVLDRKDAAMLLEIFEWKSLVRLSGQPTDMPAKTNVYSLHRWKSKQAEDSAIIPKGTRSEILTHFDGFASNQRAQYFAVLGGIEFNHSELEAMARLDGFLTGGK
jgi:hypothetical protein